MGIYVYNTLTRRKEEFVPNGDLVKIYVCGVTPYSHTHLGHARPSVVWDVIKKYLRYKGFNVFHVQNFTDIDDKIIERARQEGKTALELSGYYIQEYLDSMDGLGVERATVYPKVSDNITEIIELIKDLEDRGLAYAVDGDVFYDVTRFPDYGKLSNQRLEELQAGTRFEVDPKKRNPMDFALWKKVKPGEPAWDSPWGPGRPGWHIECSAMSKKYLGEEFDFHGGGADLIFPHHENEIAQSEGACGHPTVRYWLHNGMLNLKDEKMSKSLGNFVAVKDVLAKYPKELIRFYLLSNHYRSELEYFDGKLEEMRRGWQRLNDCVRNLADLVETTSLGDSSSDAAARLIQQAKEAKANFENAMDDDFNTALAIATLFDLMREVNGYISHNREQLDGRALQAALETFQKLGGDILGILNLNKEQGEGLTEDLLQLVLELRQDLRKTKQYELADKIRDRLNGMGVIIEDTPQGSRWKFRND